MGPSWLWMPDVYEGFFRMAGSAMDEHLELVRIDPSYRTFFDDGPCDIPAGQESVEAVFERLEPGAGKRLSDFLAEGERKYRAGMDRYVWCPGHTPLELLDAKAISDAVRLSMFGSLSEHVRSHFSHPKLIQILEFPVLFLGARPGKTPALYSLMNYADTVLGTWYPMGGMHRVVEAMVTAAERLGVNFEYGTDVTSIVAEDNAVAGVATDNAHYSANVVVAAADYHHVEQTLLPEQWRRYSQAYWDRRVMAPSSVLFYLGINCRLPQLAHHNLFFDVPFEPHARTIYDRPSWPEEPMFYVCAPSRTDGTVAPPGCENLFLLIPTAPGLAHDVQAHQRLFDGVMDRLQHQLGFDLRPHIIVRRDYAHRQFVEDYNAFRGNAYGLANTLRQTAFLKPKIRGKLPGLFFAGQLTTPGPGVPPSLISGQVAANEANRWLEARPQMECVTA